MEAFDAHSNETTGYHLFLMPEGEFANELYAIITKLAHEYGSPPFLPHVTVRARIPSADEADVLAKARELASHVPPLTFTLGDLESRDEYYKALYVRIVEQEPFRALHEQASAVFGLEPDTNYEAHLSLLYGNYPEERKAETSAALSVPHAAVSIDKLHVYRTKGVVGNWQEIGVFPLSAESA